MKKLAFKTLLLFIITILLIKLGEKYFIKENRFNYAHYKFDKLSEELEFDLLFFGSSKSYCAFNPSVFNNNLGVNAFNLAGQDQTLDVTTFVIHETLKKSKPKLIVIDVAELMFYINENDSNAIPRKAFQLPIYDNYNLSLNKIKHVKNMYKGEQSFYAISPMIRNHDSWMDVFNFNFKKSYLEDRNNIFLSNNGYLGTLQYVSNSDVEEAYELDISNKVKLKPDSTLIGDKEIGILKAIKDISEAHNVDVLFVSTPSIKYHNSNKEFYENLEQVFNDIGAKYLNMHNKRDRILEQKDFKDIVHLNYHGGFKISNYLSDYLKANYDFQYDNLTPNNTLNNNITFHLSTKMKYLNKLTDSTIDFNNKIKVNQFGYFKEDDKRIVFIMKLEDNLFEKNELDKYLGYLRYYTNEVSEENKRVSAFPLKEIDINEDKYIFARINIEEPEISKFDVFFLEKETKKASKFFTIKDLKIKNNAR